MSPAKTYNSFLSVSLQKHFVQMRDPHIICPREAPGASSFMLGHFSGMKSGKGHFPESIFPLHGNS